MNPSQNHSRLLLCAALASLSLVAACNKTEDTRSAGERVDDVVASTERQADIAGEKAREAGRELKESATQTGDVMANKARDVAITTSINGKLTADKELSALSINVDTVNGQVVLRGSAPDTASRNRATVLAQAVDGVAGVNNELTVQPPSK